MLAHFKCSIIGASNHNRPMGIRSLETHRLTLKDGVQKIESAKRNGGSHHAMRFITGCLSICHVLKYLRRQ